ncbi:uncharacterized protein LOC128860248 [Anastrepha ludens]|uniref:uncharacterized protein LOC128860248 n=1 Tax=Anastrepha ludens TaxID=28586 RepID=UPI0023B14503|nr:uncharacterized protein LOC128860248 [Anastrepha ludens]
MPRPKNTILLALLARNEFNQVICNNGKCSGKALSPHTGNIERHLKLLHPELYTSYIEKKIAAQKKNITTTPTTSNIVKANIQKCEPKKPNIELATIDFFTKSEQQLSLLEDRAFKILVQPAFQTLGIGVNRNSVLELINGCSQKLKAEIIDDLSGNLFSLKIDIATKQDITLMGINLQCIKNRSLHTKSLAIKDLQPNYTGDNIKTVISEVLNEYAVDLNQILAVSTGNDKQVAVAVNELNEELKSSLGIETTFRNKSIKSENDYNNSLEGWLECSETEFIAYKINSILSGTHILQLCMEEIFQNSEVKLKLKKYTAILKELRSQTSLFTYAYEKRLTVDCVPNWVSTYEMLERLYELKDMIIPLSATNNNLHLNDDEWNCVKECVEVYKPVYKATERLQTEQLCYSDLYIIIMDILFELEKLPANRIVKSLIDALNNQKLKLLDIELFNAAIFLDPRIRVCLDAEQKSRAKQYIIALHNRLSSLKGSESFGTEVNESLLVEKTTGEQPTTSSDATTPKSFCEFLQNLDTDTTAPTFSYLETDISMYERQPRLPLNSSVIDFWYYQHNSLSDMAYIILAIQCTEVSMECLSTALQYILSEKHNRLTASNVDHILRVKVNGTFNYEN